MEKTLNLFRVKIAIWALPITVRAYDAEDAIGLTRLLFDVPSDIDITVITEEV
jgi:hypothetical protein